MFSSLNASSYKYSSTYYHAEFEYILSGIIACYSTMQSEKVSVINNENNIRDKILYSYLKKNHYKQQFGLKDYLFDPELPESKGRIDIRIMPINPFISDEAYYIIECKRLDATNQNGTTGLNGEYISEGICRFVSSKYSSYYKTNGMIGFIVQSMNIHDNTKCINGLLTNQNFQINTRQDLQPRKIADNFGYSYFSTHSIGKQEIVIYHLMLDFSNNIQ